MGSVLIDGTRIKHAKDIIRNKLIRNKEVFLEVIRDLSVHKICMRKLADIEFNKSCICNHGRVSLKALYTKMFFKIFNDLFNHEFLKIEKINTSAHSGT